MSEKKPRWSKRRNQLAKVEKMLAARGFTSATTTASPSGTSGASTSQPKDKEVTPIPLEEDSSLLDDSFILPSVYSSEEE